MRGNALVGSDWERKPGNSFAEGLHWPDRPGLQWGFFEEMVPWLLLRTTPPPPLLLMMIKESSCCLLLLLRQMTALVLVQRLLDAGNSQAF